ncbi:MAG TPA: histidinol dehydrogenase, partial [Enterobacter sp.]|nr:histidinol dehydrogenase [Enterobacter sp.]
MAYMLKTSKPVQERQDAQRQIRETVELILADIEKRGNKAIRELSIKFDRYDRHDYRLSDAEINACINELSRQDIHDIKFAQEQVFNFARAQKECLRDLEIETRPGVILGHKNIPINAVGCYVPGGKYPLLASAHMSIITANVAGCSRIVSCAPPFG